MLLFVRFLAVAVSLQSGVEVTTLDGQSFQAELKRITPESAEFLQSGDDPPRAVPLEQVMTLSRMATTDTAPDPANSILVMLTDGAEISGTEFTATATTSTISTKSLGALDINRVAVRAVLLKPVNEEWTGQWEAFLQRKVTKDMLIIEKSDGGGLDFLSGLVSAVNSDQIPFLLDGDEIPVPRDRVTGIVFASSDNKSPLNGSIRLSLTEGTELRVRSVTGDSETLNVVTSWGQTVSCPLSLTTGIDFSSSRVHFLSDLEPVAEEYFGLDPQGKEWSPLFDDDLNTRTGLSSLWRMSRDVFANSGRPPLTLRGKRYRKGLCIFPKARIQYALDGRYSSLKALVGVDDEVAFNQQRGQPSSAVELIMEADGREIYRALIQATATPTPIDLSLRDVSTLSILVDFGDGSSVCDYLDIVDARMVVRND